MTRVAVIGNAGGGKTTLCRALGRIYDLPVHVVDRIQWQPGWQRTDPAVVSAIHAEWLAHERWIIDGFGPLETIQARFEAADTLVFVDLPLYTHCWWAMKRQLSDIVRPRQDLPPNCPMLPKTFELLRVMWWVHTTLRPVLLGMLSAQVGRRRVLHIRSRAQLATLIATGDVHTA